MELTSALVKTEGQDAVAQVNLGSLSSDEKKLIKKIDDGHKAEADIALVMMDALDASDEHNSAELIINEVKGSVIRTSTLEDITIDSETGESSGSAIVSETINGHLTEAMRNLNTKLQESEEEVNADDSAAA